MGSMKQLHFAFLILSGAIQDPAPWRIVFEVSEERSFSKAKSVREDGSDLRDERTDPHPTSGLSPDGKRRVFEVRQDGRSMISTADAEGRNEVNLTDHETFNTSPSWTSDGKRIVFASNRSGKSQIWIMDADGKSPQQLTDHPEGSRSPKVSPGSDRIAYLEIHPAREKLPPSTLRTIDLKGGGSKVVLEKVQILEHAWSPKGDRLACSLIQELQILEMPSGKAVKSFKLGDVRKELYAHAAYGMIWRPDARAIACTIHFLGGRTEGAKIFGDDQIFILPLEGKPVVIEAGGPAGPVRWTR